jgi:Zn-dependent membrane protease YugP
MKTQLIEFSNNTDLEERFEKLSSARQKKVIENYRTKIGEARSADENDSNRDSGLGSLAATVLPAVGPTLAGVSALGMSALLPELSNNHLHEIINNAKLNGRVKVNVENAPWFANNANFTANSDKASSLIGKINILGKKLFKPGIVSHEIGHANLQANKGLASFLQKHLYMPTTIANKIGLGALTYGAADKLTENEDSPVMGGLKGGLVGALANIGILLPEFEASRRGMNYMRKSSLPMRQTILNTAATIPALLSYIAAYAGPSVAAGVLNGIRNRNKNKKQHENAI